jgi:hypothetical protein
VFSSGILRLLRAFSGRGADTEASGVRCLGFRIARDIFDFWFDMLGFDHCNFLFCLMNSGRLAGSRMQIQWIRERKPAGRPTSRASTGTRDDLNEFGAPRGVLSPDRADAVSGFTAVNRRRRVKEISHATPICAGRHPALKRKRPASRADRREAQRAIVNQSNTPMLFRMAFNCQR